MVNHHFSPPFGRRFFWVTWIPSASYEANPSAMVDLDFPSFGGGEWQRLVEVAFGPRHGHAVLCSRRSSESSFWGKIWIYSGKESLYCRDLGFLTSGHPRFRTVFFHILLGRFMVFSDVFEVENSWKVNFAEFPQLKF